MTSTPTTTPVYVVTFEHWYGEGSCDPSTYVLGLYDTQPTEAQLRALACEAIADHVEGDVLDSDLEADYEEDSGSLSISSHNDWKNSHIYVAEEEVKTWPKS